MGLFSGIGKLFGPVGGAIGMGVDWLTGQKNKQAANTQLAPYRNLGKYGVNAVKTAGDYDKAVLAGYVDPAMLSAHESNKADIGATTADIARSSLREYQRIGNPGKGLVVSNEQRISGTGKMNEENMRFATEIMRRKDAAADALGSLGMGGAGIGHGAASQTLATYQTANNELADSIGGMVGGAYEDKINQRVLEILRERGMQSPTTNWSGDYPWNSDPGFVPPYMRPGPSLR